MGLLENAIYGGRIDNENDMRLLKTYLDEYFNMDIFEGKKPVFSQTTAMQATDPSSAYKLFEHLHEKDTPESFGLCSTADVSVQKMNVSTVISNIKKMSKGTLAEIKFDTDEWTNGLANILKVWKVVYKQLIDSGVPKIRDDDLLAEDPIVSLVLTEIRTGFSNVKKMADKFKKLVSVLKGEIPLEKEIEELGAALLISKVPEEWDNILEDQISPAEWLNTYFKKLIAIKACQEAAETGKMLTNDLSLSDMFNPDIFLNAYKLYCAQSLNISVDDLVLKTTFEKESSSSKVQPLKIRSLILQGSSYNNKKIDEREGESKSEYEILPVCYLSFVSKETHQQSADTITVPLFSNLTREKHIIDFILPFSGSRSAIIIKSAALSIDP